MLKYINYSVIFFLFLALLSCVPTRRFDSEAAARTAAEREALEANALAKESEEQRQLAEAEIKKIEKELQELDKDYTLVKTRYDQQLKLNTDLQILYDKLLEVNEKLTEEAAGRRRELSEEVVRKETELRRQEDQLRQRERDMDDLKNKMDEERKEIDRLRKDLEDKNSNISNLEGDKSELEKDLKERQDKLNKVEEDLAAREARVKELEAAIASRDAKAQALKEKLNQALLSFNSSDLSVEERNGKVYVSLSQNLLFAKGSANLDNKGAKAIGKLAEVLNKNTEIDVLIEGHTDSDGDAKMNWELSSKRSLSIVNQMIKMKVEPKRITAAGRGEHVPVASNSTDEGKAKNRRTDVILSPKLDAIMDILKS
ncbi:OmpA family protein [Aureispira]|nr:OmpA family protein [Aureispira sp.]